MMPLMHRIEAIEAVVATKFLLSERYVSDYDDLIDKLIDINDLIDKLSREHLYFANDLKIYSQKYDTDDCNRVKDSKFS